MFLGVLRLSLWTCLSLPLSLHLSLPPTLASVAVIDESKLEENGVSEEAVESWCVEEQAMEMDIAVLQQVEELERKVTSASLQVKVQYILL